MVSYIISIPNQLQIPIASQKYEFQNTIINSNYQLHMCVFSILEISAVQFIINLI